MGEIKLNGISYTSLPSASGVDVDIVTALDENVTDTQVPSAKTIYDELVSIKSEHQIKSYTKLEDIELTDDDMSATDFTENFNKIRNAMANASELLTTTVSYPNLGTSIIDKINADNGMTFDVTAASVAMSVSYKKLYTYNGPTILSVIIDSATGIKYRFECIIDSTSAGVTRVGAFKAVYNSSGGVGGTSELVITPDCAHTLSYTTLKKVGNIGFCDYRIDNTSGISDGVIFTFPDGYKPKSSSYKYGYGHLSASSNTLSVVQTHIYTGNNAFSLANNGTKVYMITGSFSYEIAE